MAEQPETLDYSWVRAEAKRLSTWGRWGADDEIGALNTVTPEKVLRAVACVRKGAVFSLALPLEANGPMTGAYGRANPVHLLAEDGGDHVIGAQEQYGTLRWCDDWLFMSTSCSTQWDGLAHVFFDRRMYNDRGPEDVSSHGAIRNSIDQWRDRIVTRGVLLDVAAYRGKRWLEPGEAIYTADLDGCCAAQGVEVEPGDIVLIRTGQLTQVRAQGSWGEYGGGSAPGLSATTAAWFAEHDVAGWATDTWGTEVLPYETPDTIAPLHQILLAGRGMAIGEMFELDALAADCHADGAWDCLLVAPPLRIAGGINTPVNPQAIK